MKLPLAYGFIDCTNLWLDYYVCVHVPGATATWAGSSTLPDTP